jgi:V-type H+-transporting ATPase subunit C
MMVQPGVVPLSDKYLDAEDPEGNQLWRLTCMKDKSVDYIKCMKKNGFLCQEFGYDAVQYMENQKLQSQLQVDLRNLNIKIMNVCFFNFQELFQALLHLKIMRTYVDGVLRFGIPPKFFLGIIKPAKNGDAKIMQKLTTAFAEDHLKDMYGAKEDANDEDFFPYVSNTLTSPNFLM